MRFIKKYFKIFVCIAVIVLVLAIFFFAQRSATLETGVLKDWRAASIERRVSAVQIMTGTDGNLDLLVACVDKMSTLPDSGEMAIRDAVSLCRTGIQMKENL